MKIAPLVAAVIPGVGPVVAGAIAIAGKAGGALNSLKGKIEGVTDVINGPPVPQVAIGRPVSSEGFTGKSSLAGGGNSMIWIVAIIAAVMFLPKLLGGRR